MEEQILNIKSYNSGCFFKLNMMKRYTNDKNDGRHVVLNIPESEDYHMYFCSHGKTTVKNNNSKYFLEKFDLLIYKPSGRQEIFSPYMGSYIHCIFSGKCVKEILEELELEEGKIYHITPDFKSGEDFLFYNKQIEYVRAEYRKRKKYSELSSTCMFIEFLSLYARNRTKTEELAGIKQIKQAVSDILEKVARSEESTLDIEKIIKDNHLSKSHFYRLFKKYMGTTPIRFFTTCRMTAAADYLLLYNMKIREVSERVGFEDPLYFSRLFKKEFGVSPRKYMQINKSHSHIQDK